MKHMKVLWLTAIFLFLTAGTGWGQVIADFESGTDDFYDNGWGSGFTSVSQVADPTGMSAGVLALAFDGSAGKKGDIQRDNVDAAGAQMITYFVYLPTDIPDSVVIKLWAQDNSNWAWTEVKYYAYQIPKGVWYPLDYDMEQMRANPDINFDHIANKIGKMGVEVNVYEEHDADANWSGTIYIDNVSLLGAEPKMIGDFESGMNDFYDNGWGSGFTSVSQVADPTGKSAGVLALAFDGSAGKKGDLEKDNLEAAGNQVITWYVYLPADTPDSVVFKLWAQDNSNWAWTEVKYYAYQIPKGVWYPLDYDMEQMRANPDIKFDHVANKIGKMGLEVNVYEEHDADANWSGTIYVDNVAFLSAKVGARWVMADFEKESGGTQGFANTGWGPALLDVSWSADSTGKSQGVLNTSWDFNKGAKGAFSNSNVKIYSEQADTFASKITIDVYLPADIPQGAQVSVFAQDHESWTWTEDKYFITDTTLTPGRWHTLTYDVAAHVQAGEINPHAVLTVGCQIYYSQAQTWVGDVYWDNFTLWGIPKPAGEIVSPTVQAYVDTAGAVKPYLFTHITWVDNPVGTETYNIYMSHEPITDLSAPGVVRIATKIPHGQQQWGHRPWSRDGSEQTFYYAVTAVAPDGSETGLTDKNVVGPFTLPTSVTAKAVYVSDFASKFALDGLDTEFQPYMNYAIVPESAGGPEGANWTPSSTDMNFKVVFVVDDKNLYISADVTDDDLRNPPGQAWEGDALEFYMGFYDVRLLKAYHPYRSVGQAGTGDWRIGFTAWGTTQINGTTETTIPGVKSTVYQKFTGDGYIIEAKMAIDSLVGSEGLAVVDGAMIPLRIDGTDMDPSFGDTQRTLIVQFGGSGGVNSEDWKRPGSWGYLEVLGGPVGVEEAGGKLPGEYRLYANYPNPFNPATTLRYDLPRQSKVTIRIYDVLGKLVATLVDGQKKAGSYTVQWNGTDENGTAVASGLYIAKMVTADYSKSVKMLLMK